MNKNYENKAGFTSEMELDELASSKATGGTDATCVIGIIGITLSAGICPTSACSKSCPWNK